MKNDKGYTLIELLLVITIVVMISSITIISLVTIRNKQKDNEYLNMVDNVKTASELYLMNDNEFKEYLNDIKVINLPVKKLIEEGYLDEYQTTYTLNNESIKDYCLSISLGSIEEYQYGELKKCGSFLAMYPNPLILYKGNPINLLEGIIPYDKEGKADNITKVIVESGADTKLNNNINQEVGIKYTYDGEEYTRKVKLMLLETVIDEDTVYTVEASGIYEITSYGAQGSGSGGKGGEIVGTVALEKGNALNIIVGKLGGGGAGQYAGGGATTIKLNNNELIIGSAGGGGGVTGTAGGTGTGAGGACGTNYDTNTCTNGTNGSSFGTASSISGGGSSGNYKSCTKFKTEWNPCVSGSNTCKEGYVNTDVCLVYATCATSGCGCAASTCTKYSSCTTEACGCATSTCTKYNSCSDESCGCSTTKCTKYNTCADAACGTKTCTKTYISSTACNNSCSGECDVVTCTYSCGYKSCATSGCGCASETCTKYKSCATEACGCATEKCTKYNKCADPDCGCATETCTKYNSCSNVACGCKPDGYEKKLVPCATGSNTCVGGDVTTNECETLGNSEYKSGNGGKNYYSSKIQNPVSKTGTRSGNGQVKIKYIG